MKKYVCTVCGYIAEGTIPEQCPVCKAPASAFVEKTGNTYVTEHVVGIGKAEGVPQEIVDGLRANFEGECSEVGMYLAMARVAEREGYPEIAEAYKRYAYEEADHASRFAELLGEVVTDSTKKNLMMRAEAECGACSGKMDLAWVFPEEGTVLSVDSMAIPSTSEHEEAAEMFINFMCEPDVGKANIEYIGYTTPMHCVWDILDEDLKYSEIAYPSEDIAAKEEVFTALSDEVNSELDVKWSEMKSYDEGGSGYLFLMLLAAMLALACFNIWRKVRRKTRNMY